MKIENWRVDGIYVEIPCFSVWSSFSCSTRSCTILESISWASIRASSPGWQACPTALHHWLDPGGSKKTVCCQHSHHDWLLRQQYWERNCIFQSKFKENKRRIILVFFLSKVATEYFIPEKQIRLAEFKFFEVILLDERNPHRVEQSKYPASARVLLVGNRFPFTFNLKMITR